MKDDTTKEKLIKQLKLFESEFFHSNFHSQIFDTERLNRSLSKIENEITMLDEKKHLIAYNLIFLFFITWFKILQSSKYKSIFFCFFIELKQVENIFINKTHLTNLESIGNLNSLILIKLGIDTENELIQSLSNSYKSNLLDFYKKVEETQFVEVFDNKDIDDTFLKEFAQKLSKHQISEDRDTYNHINENFFD